MRRVVQGLVGALALIVLFGVLRTAFASEETLIRWRLESMAAGFDKTRLAPCLQGIAASWRHENANIDRARLADGLRSVFFTEKDPDTRGFPYRAELVRDRLLIDLDPQDPDLARVELELRFLALQEGEWLPTWRVVVSGDMRKHDELGWQFVRSAHETLESDGRLWR